jgi:glycosyltransferase involved in cell wall biosynthesis
MRDRMNITLVNSLYPPTAVGGAEKVVQYLAEALAGANHRVSVVTLSPDGVGGVDRVGGVAVIRLPTDVPWPFGADYKTVARRVRTKLRDRYSAPMRERVRAVLAELRPDVVHTHSLMGFSASAWDAAASLGLPIIHTAHDWYLTCIRSTMLRAGRTCAGQCASCGVYTAPRKAISNRVDTFVGVSDFVRDIHLSNGFFTAARLTTVIYTPGPVRRARADASGRSGPLRLGFLGRIEAAKGIEPLLATLRPMTGDFTLRIGGAGNEGLVQRLKTQYADDRFAWLGRVDASRFFDEIDVLVVPSTWHEPFGLVIGEAHSRGIPVIAARRGGIPEAVKDGVNGVLYEPDRPTELADIIKRMLADPLLVPAMSRAIMAQPPGIGLDEWADAHAGLYRAAVKAAAPAYAAE